MDLSTTTLILTGLVTIVFLVAVILSYKTWKVYTILLVLLNFMAGMCFFYYAVRTLNTHKQWREAAVEYAEGVERWEKANRDLVEGDRDEDDKLLMPGKEWYERWLHRLALTRGRVWEGCVPGVVDENTGAVQVTVPAGGQHVVIELPAEPGGEGKAEIVYVFEEASVEDGGRYIGEFNVEKTEGGDGDNELVFHLVPTRKVQGVELTRIADRTRIKNEIDNEKGWVICAVMPRDDHRVFSRLTLVDGNDEFETLDEQELRELAPKAPQQPQKAEGESVEEYQIILAAWQKVVKAWPQFVDAWVAEYTRDMQPANPDDPPSRKWVKVSFVKLHEMSTIDSHRIMPTNKAGTFTFVPGEKYGFGDKFQVYLDRKTADELGPEIVKQIGEVYVREFREYEHLLHEYDRERVSIATEIIDIRREGTYLFAAKGKVVAREAQRSAEQVRLKQDAANFKTELVGVTAYAAQLDQHRKDVMAEVRRLHFENQALAKELAQLQLAAKRRLEGKSPEGSTSLPKKSAPGL